MEITNERQIEDALAEAIGKRLGTALRSIVYRIIEEELPKGHSSTIADKLRVEDMSKIEYNSDL